MNSAWDIQAEAHVTIGVGEADELRALCHAGRFICPIYGCTEPAITTRRLFTNRWGTTVTDGFRHQVAPADGLHSPESIRHQDAKARVSQWLSSLGFQDVRAERTVRTGHRSTTGKSGRRRPDVSAKDTGGRKVAIEVQISPIDEALWRTRTSELVAAGWTTTWLWAWEVGWETPAATTALRAQSRTGDVWFLDPYGENGARLGWAHQERLIGGEVFAEKPYDLSEALLIEWMPLMEASLTASGEIARSIDDDIRDRRMAARERERAARQTLSRRQAELVEQERRWKAESAAKAKQARRERMAAASQRSATRPRSVLPVEEADLCAKVQRNDHLIWTPAVRWKSAVLQLIGERASSERPIHRAEVVAWVEANFACQPRRTAAAIVDFLGELERHGRIRKQGQNYWPVDGNQPVTDSTAGGSGEAADATVMLDIEA